MVVEQGKLSYLIFLNKIAKKLAIFLFYFFIIIDIIEVLREYAL